MLTTEFQHVQKPSAVIQLTFSPQEKGICFVLLEQKMETLGYLLQLRLWNISKKKLRNKPRFADRHGQNLTQSNNNQVFEEAGDKKFHRAARLVVWELNVRNVAHPGELWAQHFYCRAVFVFSQFKGFLWQLWKSTDLPYVQSRSTVTSHDPHEFSQVFI